MKAAESRDRHPSNVRQDPTAEPGVWFEAFTFDTFRIKDGKLVEHWDAAVINPPMPPGAGRSGQR